MPQRSNSCPSPKSTTSSNSQTADTNGVSSPVDHASKPLPIQRRANTCPAKCPGTNQSQGAESPERQANPYNPRSNPQAGEDSLDAVFASSPGADEWQMTQTDDGRPVYSAAGGSLVIEVLTRDW